VTHHSILFATLGSENQHPSINANRPMHIGCKTYVPTVCARRPVMKDATVHPKLSALETKLIAVVCIFLGNNLIKMVVAQG
jgi:hypothetical protein